MARIESIVGRRFGDRAKPLLVSCARALGLDAGHDDTVLNSAQRRDVKA